jgi:hypothetical protein
MKACLQCLFETHFHDNVILKGHPQEKSTSTVYTGKEKSCAGPHCNMLYSNWGQAEQKKYVKGAKLLC